MPKRREKVRTTVVGEKVEGLDGFRVITEGKAHSLFPDVESVFYNPVQVFNRDFSVLNLMVFAKERAEQLGEKYTGLNVLEALSATGLRSMRYALECPDIKTLTVNDYDPGAVEVIKKNIEYNKLADLDVDVRPSCADAVAYMHAAKARNEVLDIIDCDPFGAPTPFVDSMLAAIDHGGMLLVTCTDLGVLAGNHPGTCFAKYGAVACKTPACHEMALRICLASLATAAARYKKYIVPMVSVSVDFYVRVVVRVYSSAAKVKGTVGSLGMIHHCSGCKSWQVQPLACPKEKNGSTSWHASTLTPTGRCPHCSHPLMLSGPAWIGALHDKTHLAKLEALLATAPTELPHLKTAPQLLGYVRVMAAEVEAPLYHCVDTLVAVMHCPSIPRNTLIAGLLSHAEKLGKTYAVSRTHASARGLKIDAPAEAVWDVLRAWVRENPVSKKAGPNTPARAIAAGTGLVAPEDIDLTHAVPDGTLCTEALFLPKPDYWGPGSLPKRGAGKTKRESPQAGKKAKSEEDEE
ncbi:tRNA methyltransferase Trm1 [Carpediemonas membranifera]|uniref:tRNA (guanine(26)-N(2))-dimethyltransferase n=1 Tax=Carpediemonas membranifera TaxID=201153 RepID=A0A8J6B0R4_9EUKA|nr:tRNA methyltransferase Trm1 [Carpediemonas membranifera]|eukprot:KAG9393093.1 tRNA methyltransferase Trm1 [Carpediemonas membranifera]